MVEDVVRLQLPVSEELAIQKNVIQGERGSGKRICVITGTHGDELEGQYVAWQLGRILTEKKGELLGSVEIYPSLNPMGISTIYRGLPGFDLDMNRIFPGSEEGPMMETRVSRLMSDLKGADMCIDIHASNIYLEEMPQVRINEETADQLVPYARLLNVDFVWIHAAATVLESTLAYSLNMIGVPTLVVEMGVGMRITKDYGYQLVDGILNLMKEMGIWSGPVESVREPLISSDRAIGFVNADHPGIYLPDARIFDEVMRGDVLGKIVDPLTGSVLEEVKAPITGKVFTRREYPIVYSGSLLNRILGGAEE